MISSRTLPNLSKLAVLAVVIGITVEGMAYAAQHWLDLNANKPGVRLSINQDSFSVKSSNIAEITERFIFVSPRPFRAQRPELKNKTFQILTAQREYDCEKSQGRPMGIQFFTADGKEILRIPDVGPWDAPPPGSPSYIAMTWVCQHPAIANHEKWLPTAASAAPAKTPSSSAASPARASEAEAKPAGVVRSVSEKSEIKQETLHIVPATAPADKAGHDR